MATVGNLHSDRQRRRVGIRQRRGVYRLWAQTAANTARKALHDVRDCPGCGGDGTDEERGERVHLTRAQKRWECGDCSAAIKQKTLYVVLGLHGSPVPKVIGKWPGVRRLCIECWQRIEGARAAERTALRPARRTKLRGAAGSEANPQPDDLPPPMSGFSARPHPPTAPPL